MLLPSSALIPSRETREFCRFAITALDAFVFNAATPPEASSGLSFSPALLCALPASYEDTGSGDESAWKELPYWDFVGSPLAAAGYLRRSLIASSGVASVSPFAAPSKAACVSAGGGSPFSLPTLLSLCNYQQPLGAFGAEDFPRALKDALLGSSALGHAPRSRAAKDGASEGQGEAAATSPQGEEAARDSTERFLRFEAKAAAGQGLEEPRGANRLSLTRVSAFYSQDRRLHLLLQKQVALTLLLLPAPHLKRMRSRILQALGGKPPLERGDAAFAFKSLEADEAEVDKAVGSLFFKASAALGLRAAALQEERPVVFAPASVRGYPLHLMLQLLQSQRGAALETEALERLGLAARAAALQPTCPQLWVALAAVLIELLAVQQDRFAGAAKILGSGGPPPPGGSTLFEFEKIPSEEQLLQLYAHALLVCNFNAQVWRSLAADAAAGDCGDDWVGNDFSVKSSSVLSAHVWAAESFKAGQQPGRQGVGVVERSEALWLFVSSKLDAVGMLFLFFQHTSAAELALQAVAPDETPPACSTENEENKEAKVLPSFAAATAALHQQRWRVFADCRKLLPLFCASGLGARGEGLSDRQREVQEARGSGATSLLLSTKQLRTLAAQAPPSSPLSKRRGCMRPKAARFLRALTLELSDLSPAVFSNAVSHQPARLKEAAEEAALENFEALESAALEAEGPRRVRRRLAEAFASAASPERVREWMEAKCFLSPLFLLRSKCLSKLAAQAAGFAANSAAETAREEISGGAVALAFEAEVAEAAREALGRNPAAPLSVQGSSVEESGAAASENGAARQNSETSAGSALYAAALCEAADAVVFASVQAFGPAILTGGAMDGNDAAEDAAPAEEEGGAAVASAHVRLKAFYSVLRNLERQLDAAECDLLSIAVPLYHLHALRCKILLRSGGGLWPLCALFPWRFRNADSSPPLRALDEALYLWQTKQFEAAASQVQQQDAAQRSFVLQAAQNLFQAPPAVLADAVDALQFLASKR